MHLVISELSNIFGPTRLDESPLPLFLIVSPLALIGTGVRVGQSTGPIPAIVLELALVSGAAWPLKRALSVAPVRPPVTIVGAPVRVAVRFVLLGDLDLS